ncbi:Cystinosin/ERS1p repeat [Macleaya cordata]|uniref:Cystinosin/ERS1p repeat n=1 Tax=Macleaya cordata TaxID=56857 RepID=A0A200Q082_MACCD|nr:Cystinosin/ERS1p repeat [Macleaya cordata]
MGLIEGSLPVCPRNQHCSKWARETMKYCLCGTKDAVSLSLGMLSVISWGVAEIPQIITNYKEKSTEGLSIAFLLTWIVGDLFNLFGCRLEPATVSYSFHFLYTITTGILAAQTIYYGHIYHRLKANRRGLLNKGPNQSDIVDKAKSKNNTLCMEKGKLGDSGTNGSDTSDGGRVPSSPIPVNAPVLSRHGSFGRGMYYTSARSLTKSHTPTAGSYLAQSRGSESTTTIPIRDPHTIEEPLLAGAVSAQSAPPLNTKSMLCAISAVTFFVSSFDLHFSVNNRHNMVLEKPLRGVVIRVGRKLLQNNVKLSLLQGSERNSEIGTILGWAMAAIYMGGRLPQICLNVR